MAQIKRSQTDPISLNKKLKSDHSVDKSVFERLPNDILYEVFDYLQIIHIYDAFLDLNDRFQNLLIHSNLPMKVNISTMSKSTFKRYHVNVIIPNRYRIAYLRLFNPFTVEMIFYPPRIIEEFIQLEKLVLEQIYAKYIRNILLHAGALEKLHSLVISLIEPLEDLRRLWTPIFLLRKLKYCKVTYDPMNQQISSFYLSQHNESSIEHLVLNTSITFNSLDKFLSRFPKLRRLAINNIIENWPLPIDFPFTSLNYLKYISLKLDGIPFDLLESFIRQFFHRVEVFSLTVLDSQDYLNAHRWEKLILSSMPELRHFDFHHHGGVENDSQLYHHLIDQFNSSFWTQRGWYFTHQHPSTTDFSHGLFYSTNPYPRREYYIVGKLDGGECSFSQENNLRHIRISDKENIYSNVTELTIEEYLNISNRNDLFRLLPLKRLNRLNINNPCFRLDEILYLLSYTRNLQTLTFQFPLMSEEELSTIEEHPFFRVIATKNQIRYVFSPNRNIQQRRRIPFLMKLFPRMEYLHLYIDRQEITDILVDLFGKKTHSIHRLVFLAFSGLPRTCLHDVHRVIQSRKLLENYSWKYLNRILYIWW